VSSAYHQESTPAPPGFDSDLILDDRGYIQVASGTTILGYLSKKLNSVGNYGFVTATTDQALHITVPTTGGQLDIFAMNGNANYPYLGAGELLSSQYN
jgi:hypothetical protein